MTKKSHILACKDFPSRLVEHLENEKGSIEIYFCGNCGEATRVICEHKKNTWKGEEGGRKLTCDLCGSDGT